MQLTVNSSEKIDGTQTKVTFEVLVTDSDLQAETLGGEMYQLLGEIESVILEQALTGDGTDYPLSE